jgi:DNA helicase-2/ATP-dependent DNA helicase PcrA
VKDFDPTPEQGDAIAHPPTPLLIVAGAGTGKTTVMAERIFDLVRRHAATDDQILGLTFSNKAAANLKSKVLERLPNSDVTVSTYHAFGAGLVADHALELGLAPRTQILDHARKWQLLFSVFDEFHFELRRTGRPGGLIDEALKLADRCGDHLVPLDAVVADCHDVAERGRWGMPDVARKRLELCQVIAAYERRKRELDLIDFGDQIALAVRLIEEHPEVGEALRDQYPIVLLDEYQDTNYAQRRLLQLVYPEGSAVTAVGDDMQSIYAFRGAHLRNIQGFGQHFPPVEQRQLQTTFRFGPELVELANRIQANVAGSLEKELAGAKGAEPTVIESFLASDDLEEAATIADDVHRGGAPWAQYAVLCRKRRLIPAIADALSDHGIPVEVIGSSGLLDRPEIVDLVSWLEVVADPTASVALLRVLQGPRYRIGFRDLAALARHAASLTEGDDRGVLSDALAQLDEVGDLSAAARARLDAFWIERRELATAALRLPVLDLAEAIVDRTGLWKAAGERGRENLLRFLDLTERFTPIEGDPGLPAFLEYLQLLDETEEDVAEAHPSDRDAVKVMTIHQAKGLEFPVVFVPGLAGSKSSKIFPDGRSGENALSNSSSLPWWLREDEGIPSPWAVARRADIDDVIKQRKQDEEWRLLYVACTRAERRLVCSAAHWYAGPAEPQGPSPFYDFVSGQLDIVKERFRHDAAEDDPAETRRQRQLQASGVGRIAAVTDDSPQLQLDDIVVPVAAGVAERDAPNALSVTSLVSLTRCPKQFWWSVVRPLPRRPSPAARVGTAVHRWIEQRADRQLSLLDPEPEPVVDDGGGSDGRRAVDALQASFLASPYAELDPVRVEAPFVLAVGGRLVRGRVDAAYERDGRLEVVDFKTGRPPVEGDPGGRTQIDVYGLAAVDAWRADPAAIRTTYCYLTRDGEPELVSEDWSASTPARVRGALGDATDVLQSGTYEPAPGPWCARCDFLDVCPAGRQTV